MRRFIAGLLAVLALLSVVGCIGPKARYTIIMRHDWAAPTATKARLARPVTPGDELGHVIADDPWWETNGWYAWVIIKDQAGNIVENPTVEWTTDIPESIRIVYYMPNGETDAVLVTAFPNSAMGKGKLYARYGDAVAQMTVVAYGPSFGLTVGSGSLESEGWSRTAGIVADRTEADFWVSASSGGPARFIKAPYGICRLGDESQLWEWGFFERFATPADNGFATEIPLAVGVYEVIGRDGTHYKIAPFRISGADTGEWYETTTFTWAPFW